MEKAAAFLYMGEVSTFESLPGFWAAAHRPD
jgi:hypothetical protein